MNAAADEDGDGDGDEDGAEPDPGPSGASAQPDPAPGASPHVLDPGTGCLRRALRGRGRTSAPSFHPGRRGGAGGEAAPRRASPAPSVRRRGAAVGAEGQRPVTGRSPGSSGRAPGLLRPRPRPPRVVPTPSAPPRPGAPPRPCERVPPAGPGEKGAIVRTFLPLLLDTHFPRTDADSSDNKGVCAFHPAEQKKEVNEDTALRKKKLKLKKKIQKKTSLPPQLRGRERFEYKGRARPGTAPHRTARIPRRRRAAPCPSLPPGSPRTRPCTAGTVPARTPLPARTLLSPYGRPRPRTSPPAPSEPRSPLPLSPHGSLLCSAPATDGRKTRFYLQSIYLNSHKKQVSYGHSRLAEDT